MPDRVSVTSSKSWFSRLIESIKSVVVGLALFVIGFPILFWNEGRAVKRARALAEGAGIVVSVSSDTVDPSNEGRLVHVSGVTSTDAVLTDETFGVSENAIQLEREVEMYQWVEEQSTETETKLGGGEETTTTYEYKTEWNDYVIDSADFHTPSGHQNPGAMPYDDWSDQADTVTVGAFELSYGQIAGLDKSESLPVSELPPGLVSGATGAQLHGGGVYIGENPSSPTVGDTRVNFTVTRPGPVSVVAQQLGTTFGEYETEVGGSVSLLEESIVSADAMFASAQAANTQLTWILRGVGFVVMFVGLAMVLRPISVFGDVVPVIGSVLGAGTSIVAGFIAASCAFVTIAIAWITYRPVLGVALLVLGGGALFMLLRISKKRSAAGPPPLPQT